MMKPSGQSPARKLTASISLAFFAMVICSPATSGEPEAKRQGELIHQLIQDCGSCHGLTLKGGLGPALLPQDLINKDDERLTDIILYGVPGTPMPPWEFEISKEEASWLVKRMKEGNINER
ncbi:MAG: cytochrome c [Rhodospirillaceae bacterium]|nr:cytochrome c [Rhodospirillaceae bacterium]